MRKYLDEKFARAARIAGNPYFIIFNLIFFVTACIFAQNILPWLVVWMDVIISIWTLELDLIIVNQNNRQNDSNTAQLEALREALTTIKEMADRQITLENQIIKMEKDHGEKLDNVIVILQANKKRSANGRFK